MLGSKLVGSIIALALLASVPAGGFSVEPVSISETQTVRLKTKKRGKYVLRKTKSGSRMVARKSVRGSKKVGRKSWRTGRKVVSRSKKVLW